MTKKSSRTGRSKKDARPIFEAIRKPLETPGHPLTHAMPDENARPAQRKAKHKQRPEASIEEDE